MKKYFLMTRRERKYEMQSTLWYMPLFYILLSSFMAGTTLFLDLYYDPSLYVPDVISISANATQMLVSTLIGGILTLSAFTLNSLLVVLTTFSAQFSPRMLLNFVSDRRTQHALGVFNGNFVYVLFVFLFIGSTQHEQFVFVPLFTIGLAFSSAMTFVYFINHATTWMQVHNITDTMKENSRHLVKNTLGKELEIYRTEEPGDLMKEHQRDRRFLTTSSNGYLQLVDYRAMIEEARRDDVIVRFHAQMGNFVLKGNRLLSVWGPGSADVDLEKYRKMIKIGHKEMELQDIQLGMHKLAELAVKAIGNNDPKTAINTVHQMGELMISVTDYITFTPYLNDKSKQVRIILFSETFESYLYKGFGFIRYYARKDHLLMTELIKTISKIAESLHESKHSMLWDFCADIFVHLEAEDIYKLDRTFLLKAMQHLAEVTGEIDDYDRIEAAFLQKARGAELRA
ncbi:DUF2254 domain-containing protein [Alkalicoccus urumqiensis]|uniref:DUF2254 domain-containing protein n=1 Tax=Alkalicoccus urumqiensis TaxID=1548213 RepID=UPI001FDEA600|nr:DUF2254 domain-containing protein [Alkalicoccus urumqiensis]